MARTVRFLALGIALGASLLLPAGCGREQANEADGGGPRSAERYDVDGRLRAPVTPPGARPNVIVLVIDTLRADALNPGAEGGGAMPNLAALARDGVTFSNAIAPAPWTFPSLATLLTGRLPSAHGITGEDGLPIGLAPLPTLAEILANTFGYETTALVGDAWPSGPRSLLEGFRHAAPHFALRTGPATLERWNARRVPTQPFFLLLHTFEAHNPYGAHNHPAVPRPASMLLEHDPVLALGPAPEPAELARRVLLDADFRDALMRNPLHAAAQESVVRYLWSGYGAAPRPALAEELRRAYLDGVRWVDGLLAASVGRLRTLGLLENTLLVITGDHGEAFGEHGVLHHGRILHDELIRVPLVMVGPPGSAFRGGRTIDGSVGLVDLMPTILEALGAPPPEALDGVSLIPVVRGEAPGHPVLSEETRTLRRTAGQSDAVLASVRNESWKVIVTYDRISGRVIEQAFDLRSDPEEQRDLADAHGRVLAVPLDEVFCAALERVRERIDSVVGAAPREPGAGTPPAPRRGKFTRACELSEVR